MKTLLKIEAGTKGQTPHLQKDLQAIISYKLFPHLEALEPMRYKTFLYDD